MAGLALERGPISTALDLGTGSGIIAMLLAASGANVTAIDSFPAWAPYWEQTQRASQVKGDIRFACLDVGDWPSDARRFEAVVCNPPFFTLRSGPASADPWKRAARTEGTASLSDFVVRALALATERVCIVVPRQRECEVFQAGATHDAPATVHLRVGRKRSLFELQKGGTASRIEQIDEDGPRVRGWYHILSSTNPNRIRGDTQA